MKKIVLLGLICMLFQSCYKEKFEPIPSNVNWKPDFALPILTKTYTIERSLVLEGIPEINLDEDVPEWAQYINLTFSDTVAFALSDIFSEADFVRFVEFKINLENDFPSTGEIQLYFIDDQGLVVDSLFNEDPLLIVSSNLDQQGVIQERGKSNTLVEFTQERIEKIQAASYVVPISRITNLDVPIFMFSYYPGYSLTFTLSARIGVDIPI